MTSMDAQLGVVNEGSYGTPGTPSRFFEFTSENIAAAHGRTASSGMRPGRRAQHSERWEPYKLGAAGPIVLDVPTKGFGFWLEHMLGSVSTGAVVDSNYTHTATQGSLFGTSFTAQLNRPFYPSGTAQPHTFHGGKLTSWELGCDVEGVLVATLNPDFEDEDTSTALATASYASDWRVFSWAGASLTFDAGAVDVQNLRFSCDLGLKTDRRYLRGSDLKKEPTESAFRQYGWSLTVDHDALTNYDRYRSSTRVGAQVAIVGTFDGPVAHGGSTLPRLEVTIPLGRVDQANHSVQGPEGLMDQLAGIALDDVSQSPMTVTYRTTDATP